MKQMQNKHVCTFTAHIRHLHIIVIQLYNTAHIKDPGDIIHYIQITVNLT